jgi:hypothetical protein
LAHAEGVLQGTRPGDLKNKHSTHTKAAALRINLNVEDCGRFIGQSICRRASFCRMPKKTRTYYALPTSRTRGNQSGGVEDQPNVEDCGRFIVAAPVHASSRAPLLLPLLLSHNLPLPRLHSCVMGRLVHKSLGSSSLVAHVLHYPPSPTRTAL